ncbi:AMP-dependent synthetase [Propionigenium maris DSM 9537]|uniref:AMP-dependent synthetase n=1 Tax=Propionigenium maris DSM 9537 TaxID=1123000 RepID=A0A9W6GNY1_9FUSO|nr:AMP-binding protein [Propionigenium maris]GLI57922.1 AMP-dependent synthetase [Propionigenium maris DSM 9537]
MKRKTIIHLFEESVKRYRDNILVWEKQGGEYRGITYREVSRLVMKFAGGLMDMGIETGETISIVSEGRSQWIITELGILYAGAVSVPISTKIDELPDLIGRLKHAQCTTIVVSKNHLKKILAIKDKLPHLKRIIHLDTIETAEREITSIDEVYRRGEVYLSVSSAALLMRSEQVGEEDPASICYTSGTSGNPKGIVLTHKNYITNVEQSSAVISIPEWYTSLLILPWDHSFAHTAGIYTLMKNGASIASVEVGETKMETLKNIPKNIREIKPVFLLTVPSLVQNFKKNIERSIEARGRLTKVVFNIALAISCYYRDSSSNKTSIGKFLVKPLYTLFDRTIFSRIREGFGGRLKFFIGGGSLLSLEMQTFFSAIGLPIYQGYGLTEAAPVISANAPGRFKLGSSGIPVKDMEIKICSEEGVSLPPGERGEICVRGENVMKGYWRDPDSTREVIREEWLHTGDLGYLDGEGFLYVLGRKKTLLIGDDGEKYSPEGIEETICSSSPLISQMILYNNQSSYTVALIVLDSYQVKELLKRKKLTLGDERGQRLIIKVIEEEIKRYRYGDRKGTFPSRWLPSAFSLLEEGFTEENGLLNSTLKIVRLKILRTYKEKLEFMYTSKGKDIYNSENLKCISRL